MAQCALASAASRAKMYENHSQNRDLGNATSQRRLKGSNESAFPQKGSRDRGRAAAEDRRRNVVGWGNGPYSGQRLFQLGRIFNCLRDNRNRLMRQKRTDGTVSVQKDGECLYCRKVRSARALSRRSMGMIRAAHVGMTALSPALLRAAIAAQMGVKGAPDRHGQGIPTQ